MLSVSTQYQQAINADSRSMRHRVTLGGIVFDRTKIPKMALNENIGGSSNVSLGTANSAELRLTLREPESVDYTDTLVEPESGIELPDGTIEWLPLGKFYVTDFSTRDNYKTVELTCADGMYLMSGEYVSALEYPALVRDVAHEIAEQAGVELVDLAEWPEIYIRKKPEKLTLRNAIGYVAGCCGKNARFNRYGKLEFVWYKDTGLTIERTQQYLDGFARLNDQPLNVKFEVKGETEKYKVTIISDDNGNVLANPGTNVLEGDTVKLSIVPLYQYELASISIVNAKGEAVPSWRNAEGDEYSFVQPDSDVTVTVSFRSVGTGEGVETTGGEYSFLQHPSLAAPPTQKLYWAIFYNPSTSVGANAKYYLVWFDSWSLGNSIYLDGNKRGYYLNMDGYYYCQGANNGSGQHYWDDAVWQGNGTSGAALSWRMGVGRWCDGYGLIASNVSLGDIFTANDSEVGTIQTDWRVGGVDIRERGAFSLYACPDTYSTPLPGKYWMLTNHIRVYKTGADGNYESLLTGASEYVLFFDGCIITDLGKYYPSRDKNYLKLTFSKLTVASYVGYDEFYYAGERTFNEECYIIIGDPDYSSEYESGGGLEYSIGLYATNLSSSYFTNNSPMICGCVSAASEPKMFAMRRSVGATVTMEYTNPLITSKMVESISAVVEGVTYTPARVKHRGNPAFEVGDIVTVPDRDGNYHTVLIMQQTMNFGGGMNAEITCPGQTERKTSFSTTGALTTQIKKVVQEESSYQRRELDTYNALVVSALGRGISSMSRQVNDHGIEIGILNEWRSDASVALSELSVKVDEHSVEISDFALWQSSAITSLASIEKRVSNNESAIELLSKWEGEGAESLAELVSKVNENTSSISALTQWKNTASTTLANIELDVNANKSSIQTLTQWKSLVEDDISAIASIQNTANDHEASIIALTKWQTDTNKTVAEVVQKANDNYSSIVTLTEWTGNQVDDLTESIAKVEQKANANESNITTLTNWKNTTDGEIDGISESLAQVEQKANANGSSITSLTTWKGTASADITNLKNGLSSTNESLAKVEQKANSNGSSITSLTTWKSTASNDINNLKNGLSATNTSVAEVRQIANDQGADIESIVKWQDATNINIATIEEQVSANGSSIGMVVKNGKVQGGVLIEAINGETSAKISADRLDIVGKELNIKVASTNITGELSVSKISGGTNNQPIVMTDFTATGGKIAGFTLTEYGFEAKRAFGTEEKTLSYVSMFRAGLYYYSSIAVTVRNYGNSTMWWNKVYNVKGAKRIDISGLPSSNCEVFILAELPTSAHSVTSANDTSKAITPYYHNASPGTNWFIVSDDFVDKDAYLIINSSANVTPNVTIEIDATERYFYLNNDGSFALTDSEGQTVRTGLDVPGFAVDSADYSLVNSTGSRAALESNGIYFYSCYSHYGFRPITFEYSRDEWDFVSRLHGLWFIEEFGSSTPVTSDRTKKFNIEEQSEVYSRVFDRLVPVTFKYNNGTSDRTHLGLIAQDVEDAVLAEGLTTQEFAPVVYSFDKDGNKVNYGIRYEELVSLCIHEIQKLKSRLEKTDG